MAKLVAILATTHHPFFYKTSQLPPDEAPPFAAEWVRKVDGLPRDADPGPARRAGDGRLRPLPPAVARQHAAVPGRQGAVLRRQLLQRGARVRPAEAAAQGARGALGVHAARGHRPRLRPGVLQRAAGRPLDHLPDLHRAPAERPADRADLHQHLRAAAAAARAVRPARPDDPRDHRRLAESTCASPSSAPGTCRSSSAGRGSSARTARTRSSTPRRSSGSRTATSTAAWPRSPSTACTRPGNATHGFMDFMLMMGIAGHDKADYADNLDLFHTMEAYFTWYPNGVRRR